MNPLNLGLGCTDAGFFFPLLLELSEKDKTMSNEWRENDEGVEMGG